MNQAYNVWVEVKVRTSVAVIARDHEEACELANDQIMTGESSLDDVIILNVEVVNVEKD